MIEKNLRSWAPVATLAVIGAVLLGYALFDWSANPSTNPHRVRSAIEKAAAYLSSVELRGDDSWIATQGALKLGPDFRAWAETLLVAPVVVADSQRDPLSGGGTAGVEGNLWNLRWLEEAPLSPRPVPDVQAEHPAHTALSEAEIFSIVQTMAHTVACHRLGDLERETWLRALSEEKNSYVLTHQLIALILGQYQGCIDAATAASMRETLATRVWLEQTMDRGGFTDLSIERMASLCYAQLCGWISDDWLNELLRKQQPSGSWGDQLNANVHPRVIAREEHGAAMAFYVLASVWNDRFADAAGPQPPQ